MVTMIVGLAFGCVSLYLFLIMPRLSGSSRLQCYHGQMWAHRGLHCIEKGIPENSMAAFKEAVKHGYGIELDVHLTKDRQLVVFHDDTLERVCGKSGVIEELTYGELSSCYLSGTAERISLLSTVLCYVNGRVPLLIEVKLPERSSTICQYLAAELDEYQGAFLIQSFNTMVLHWFKRNRNQYVRGQLSSNLVKSTRAPHVFLRFCTKYLLCNCLGRPDFISYKLEDSSNISVRFLHRILKTPVAVWTIRSEEALEKARAGFDMYIFERFVKVL